MKPRTLLFWMHLAAGVTAGLVILIMSATGVLLMYERQLIEWSDRGYRLSVLPAGVARLSVEQLLARAEAQRGDQVATAVTLRSDPHAPAAVTLGPMTVYQNVYTGDLLGEPSTGIRGTMSELRAWHRWIAMEGEHRAIGKAISGWANLVFLFIVLSGMYLWLPRGWNWPRVRAVSLLKTGLRGKARDFNWHNVIGIWSAVPLAVIVAAATPISFPWANGLVYRIAGDSVPPAGRPAGNRGVEPPARVHTEGLNALWARAEQQVPGWRSISVRLPVTDGAPAVFAIDSGTGGQPQLRSTLTLDAITAAVVRWEPFDSQSRGRRLRSWARFTHTGEYYGLAGQTLAGLVSAGAVVLVWTGLSLALRRFFGKSSTSGGRASTRDAGRRKRPEASAAPAAAARVWSES
jgi:uncharacterized iron-regulated membrane protein